jgi:hypothetical protein
MADIVIQKIGWLSLITSSEEWAAWIRQDDRLIRCNRLETEAPTEFPVRVEETVENPSNIHEPSYESYALYRPTELKIGDDTVWEYWRSIYSY